MSTNKAMPANEGGSPLDYGELARALIREGLPQQLAAQIAGEPNQPCWADKTQNPYGSARAFLDAARRGDFKSFRRARRITARWSDVAAAIERTKGAARRKPCAAVTLPEVDIGALVEDARPRKKRAGGGG